MTDVLAPPGAARKPEGGPCWRDLRAELVSELKRQERQWFERAENPLNARVGDIADQALIETQVALGFVEDAATAADAFRWLLPLAAKRPWVADLRGRISECWFRTERLSLDEEVCRA